MRRKKNHLRKRVESEAETAECSNAYVQLLFYDYCRDPEHFQADLLVAFSFNLLPYQVFLNSTVAVLVILFPFDCSTFIDDVTMRIVNVSNISNPVTIASYFLLQPYKCRSSCRCRIVSLAVTILLLMANSMCIC